VPEQLLPFLDSVEEMLRTDGIGLNETQDDGGIDRLFQRLLCDSGSYFVPFLADWQ
jgi:hypothetical protein